MVDQGSERDEPTPDQLRGLGERLVAELPGGDDPHSLLLLLIGASMTSLQRGGAATLGPCAVDGTSLSYEGHLDGLRVCCGGRPQHCWKPTGELIKSTT